MRKHLFILILLTAAVAARGQQLVFSGKIVFERKENLQKQQGQGGFNRAQQATRTDLFELAFTSRRSLYKLIKEAEGFNGFFDGRVASANTVSMQLKEKRYVAEKTVFDQTYAIQDSLPVYQWKMLGEFRTIAGYSCRKAATIINDSLYVIAFYTDQIPVSAGPESIQGLPGMILGVAVPRLHLTYFATSVDMAVPADTELTYTPKKRAKTATNKTFITEIMEAMKSWGEMGNRIYFRSLL